MTISLSRPMRRLAAVALLILAFAAVALTTIVPLAARVGELRDRIDAERALLGRLTAVAALKARLADYEQVGRAALQSGAYLAGESEALMAAGLQTTLAQLAAAARVRFNSTRTLPPRERDTTRFIGVSLQFRADSEQLRTFLFRIESHRPFLFVEGLQIRPVSPFSQSDARLNGLLDVRVDAYGAVPGKGEPVGQ